MKLTGPTRGNLPFDIEKLVRLNRDDEAISNADKIKGALEEKDLDLINYIEYFKAREENQKFREENYDVLIYTVGFSPYTTLLSLSLLAREARVIFVYTKESYEKFHGLYSYYLENFMDSREKEYIIVENASDTVEGFSKISEKLDKLSGTKVAIDITGGKKPTVAIGFLSAALETDKKVDILYMDFEKYYDDRPEYGSEFMNRLLNPVDILSEVDKRSLEELYQSKNFKGARVLAENILEKMDNNRELLREYRLEHQYEEIERIGYFSRLYENRINFNYGDIKIDSRFLDADEVSSLQILKEFYRLTANLSGEERDRSISKIYDEKQDLILYASLDRYISAKNSEELDLQNYIMRLISSVELVGIVALSAGVEGQGCQTSLVDKIDSHKEFDKSREAWVKKELHKLRKERNNLSIVHGSMGVSKSNRDYERAVLFFIKARFYLSDIEDILDNSIGYRSYEEIFKEGVE